MKSLKLFITRWRLNYWFNRMNYTYQMGMTVDTSGGITYWQQQHNVAGQHLAKAQADWRALLPE